MNDNKSRDIFYGVVAIATLIVAIVGATLAYFSISAGSREGAVSAKAAVVSVNYTDGVDVITQARKLIPSRFDIMQFFYEKNKDDIANSTPSSPDDLANDPTLDDDKNPCKDNKQNQVCSVYRFSVTTDVGNQNIKAYLYTENNSFSTNHLAYAIRRTDCTYTPGTFFEDTESTFTTSMTINGPYESCWMNLGTDSAPTKYLFLQSCSDSAENPKGLGLCYTTDGTIKTYNASGENKSINSVFGNDGTNDRTVQVTGTASSYDVVIFLHDNGQNQDVDQGAEFRGTLKVEVVDANGGNGQVTGRVNDNG